MTPRKSLIFYQFESIDNADNLPVLPLFYLNYYYKDSKFPLNYRNYRVLKCYLDQIDLQFLKRISYFMSLDQNLEKSYSEYI